MKNEQLEGLLEAAKRHGEDSEPEHEVGDLQDLLRAAVEILTDEQFERFFASEAVTDVLDWGGQA